MEGQSKGSAEKPRIVQAWGGPMIEGTRTSVYFIYEFYQHGRSAAEIAARTSNLSVAEIQAAIDYIEAHKPEVVAEYEKIMARIRKGNPPEVEAKLLGSREKIKAYIQAKKQSAAGA